MFAPLTIPSTDVAPRPPDDGPPTTAVAPSPRLASGIAHDSGSDRTILFGGFTEQRVFLGDTWAFDLDNNTWTNMNPSVAPRARGDPGLAYDPDSGRVVLFGGIMKLDAETSYVDLNDTWSYDFDTNAWQVLGPTTAPSPRHGHKVAYDTESHRLILVGGHTCRYDAIPVTCTLYGDTWAFDYENASWTEMAPSTGPSTPNFHGFAYDAESDQAVLYGGDGSTTQETWAYDLNANTWTRLNPQQNPGSLSFLAMAYDAQSDRVVLFGGLKDGSRSAETWAYNLNTNAWSPMTSVLKPSARQDHAMAYDVGSDRVVLFGGCRDFELYCNNETWAYDFESNTWTPLTRPSAPRTLAASSGVSRVELSWLAPITSGGVPIGNYRIYRGTISGGLNLLAEIAPVLTYADTAVTNGVTYYYAVTAVTAAGEGPPSNEVPATPSPEPDAIKPTVTITSPVEDATLSTASVTVSGTASDNVALSKVELSRDGTNWILAIGTTSWSGTLTLVEGANRIYANATDTSGNSQVDSVNVTVNIEPTDGSVPRRSILDDLGTPAGITGIVIGIGVLVGAVWLVWKRRKGGPPEP